MKRQAKALEKIAQKAAKISKVRSMSGGPP